MVAEERGTHVIAVPDNIPPWTLAFEVAQALPEESWVLVGGLMVHAHAIRAGVNPPRPTRDLDLLLNIGVRSYGEIVGPLQGLGFRPLEPSGSGPFHRFTRGDDVVDVMVANNAPSVRQVLRPVLRAPGAAQALARRELYKLQGQKLTAFIGLPDSLGALVVKAAAYGADSRDRGRHLEDLAVLFATCESFSSLDARRLRANEKGHLRPALRLLKDHGHVAWAVLDDYDQLMGQRICDALTAEIGG